VQIYIKVSYKKTFSEIFLSIYHSLKKIPHEHTSRLVEDPGFEPAKSVYRSKIFPATPYKGQGI
jgi:hypothetical protein